MHLQQKDLFFHICFLLPVLCILHKLKQINWHKNPVHSHKHQIVTQKIIVIMIVNNNNYKESLRDSSWSLALQLWSWHHSMGLGPRKSAWSSPSADQSFSVPSQRIAQQSPFPGMFGHVLFHCWLHFETAAARSGRLYAIISSFSLYLKNALNAVLGYKYRKQGRKGLAVHIVCPHPGHEWAVLHNLLTPSASSVEDVLNCNSRKLCSLATSAIALQIKAKTWS